jgi:hypothetical protein
MLTIMARLRVLLLTAGGLVVLLWITVRWDAELATERRHAVVGQVQSIAASLRAGGSATGSALDGLGSIERLEIIDAIRAPAFPRRQEFRVVFRRDVRGPIGLSTQHVWSYLSFQASDTSFTITKTRVDETFN